MSVTDDGCTGRLVELLLLAEKHWNLSPYIMHQPFLSALHYTTWNVTERDATMFIHDKAFYSG